MSENDDSAALPRRTILKFYLFKISTANAFTVPVIVLFLMGEGGLSFTQIAILESVFWAIWGLSEFPTGYVGDRIGRRNTLLASTLLCAVSVISFGFARSLAAFTAIFGLWAIGTSLRSGTVDAWLYDSLRDNTSEEAYTRLMGRGNALLLFTLSIGSILGAYMATYDLYYPFVATGAVNLVGFFALLGLPESSGYRDPEERDVPSVGEAVAVVREQFTGRPLRSFVIYGALLFAVPEVAETYVQPTALAVGVEVAHLGWLYAGFTTVSGLLSYYLDDLKRIFGMRTWFLVTPYLVGGAFLALFAAPVAAVPAFFVMRAVRRGSVPLIGQFVNDHTPSVGRATVMSLVPMFYAAFVVPLELVTGVVADTYSSFAAYAVLGTILLVGATLIILVEPPIDAAASPESDPSTPS